MVINFPSWRQLAGAIIDQVHDVNSPAFITIWTRNKQGDVVHKKNIAIARFSRLEMDNAGAIIIEQLLQ